MPSTTNQRNPLQKLRHPLTLALLLVLSIILVYAPGIHGGFYFDDFPNLVHNAKLGISELSIPEINRAAHSSASGPFGRPVAMGSFALNHYFAQYNPLPYKVTNIAIHIANTMLVYLFFTLLIRYSPITSACRQQWIPSLFAAAYWGLHPLGITSVLYIVQRMNSLATLFTLLTLISFVHARVRLKLGLRFLFIMLIPVSIFGLLAVLSKETALLLPLFILLVEFFFFFDLENTPRYWRITRQLGLATVIAAGLYWLSQNLLSSTWTSQVYSHRFFDIWERALTETRILWTYWQFILLPNIQNMGLHLDDVALSKGLFTPISTFFAVIGHILMLMLAIASMKKYRVLSFGILWFYTGHLLESTIFPLELMYEHRNYLPMLGPIFAIAYYGYLGMEKASEKLTPVLHCSAFVLLMLLGCATGARAIQWGDQWQMPFIEATHHPYSTRANFFAGRACGELMIHSESEENRKYLFDCALTYLNRSAAVNRSVHEPMIAIAQLYVSASKPIPQKVIAELRNRLAHNPLGNDGAYLGKGLLDLGLAREEIITNAAVIDLLQATLNNPKLSGTNRAHVLIVYGMFLCDGMNLCVSAIPVFEEAVKASQEIQFMVVLSTYYLRVGRATDAIALIHHARGVDPHNIFEVDLDNLEKHAMLYFQRHK